MEKVTLAGGCGLLSKLPQLRFWDQMLRPNTVPSRLSLCDLRESSALSGTRSKDFFGSFKSLAGQFLSPDLTRLPGPELCVLGLQVTLPTHNLPSFVFQQGVRGGLLFQIDTFSERA